MEHECVARVKNVKALDVAFLDQRIPRYERDIINMVGMGVTENAASNKLMINSLCDCGARGRQT